MPGGDQPALPLSRRLGLLNEGKLPSMLVVPHPWFAAWLGVYVVALALLVGRMVGVTQGGLLKVAVLLDMIAVALVVPLLPFHARGLGLSQLEWSWVALMYGVGQILSGPLMGLLAARVGRQRGLVVSQLGAALSYGLLATATGRGWFVASRAVVALTRQTAMLTRGMVPPGTKRADHLADVSSMGSLAMVVGPIIGGQLAHHTSNETCFGVASALLMSAAMLSWLVVLPAADDAQAPKDATGVLSAGSQQLHGVWGAVALSVASTFVLSLISSTYVQRAQRVTGRSHMGLALSVSGVVSALSSRMVRRIVVLPPPRALHRHVALLCALAAAAAIVAQEHIWPSFVVHAVVLSALAPQLTVAAHSALMERVHSPALLGVDDALSSIARSSSPLIVTLVGSDAVCFGFAAAAAVGTVMAR